MKKIFYFFLRFEKKLLLSKTVLSIIFCTLSVKTGYCQAPSWLWAKNAKAGVCMQGASGYSVATDRNQNVFECGKFDNEVLAFGSYTLLNANGFQNTGNDDIFLAKYDANGNVLWAKSAGGTSDDGAIWVATDKYGNSYVTGWFSSASIAFGSDTLLNPNQVDDIYIAKYDVNGNVLWVKKAEGNITSNSYIWSASVATDATGNAYLLGNYSSSTIIFGRDTLINITNNTNGTIFIVKYDANGNVVWAKNGLTSGAGDGSTVALDAKGNIYITGWIYGSEATFGSNTIINPVGGEDKDVFIAKYDNNGNVIWVRNAYSEFFSEIGGATDSLGNSFVIGNSDSPNLAFGTDTVIIDYKNGFLFKFDNNGNVLWAKNMVCTAGSGPTDVTIAPGEDIYVTGIFYGPYIAFSSDTLTNSNSYNNFLAKYDKNGNIVWANGVSNASWTEAFAVAADDNGNAYITGNFGGDTLIFGFDTLNSDYSTVFLAKSGAGGITGINQVSNKNGQIKVYPNPSKGVFIIQANGQQSAEADRIEIYNVLGQQVYKSNINSDNTEINLSNQPDGVYLYRVTTLTGELVGEGKLVKQ